MGSLVNFRDYSTWMWKHWYDASQCPALEYVDNMSEGAVSLPSKSKTFKIALRDLISMTTLTFWMAGTKLTTHSERRSKRRSGMVMLVTRTGRE
jgi:hypothetical protein